MSERRVKVVLIATFFLGLGLTGSFPHGTMIVGGLSWDYLGGIVVGLSLGVGWARSRHAAERMGRVKG